VWLFGHDQNDGVRLKPWRLKSFAKVGDVRDALSQALLHRRQPGVRDKAIDMLIRDWTILPCPISTATLIGTLQELMLARKHPACGSAARECWTHQRFSRMY